MLRILLDFPILAFLHNSAARNPSSITHVQVPALGQMCVFASSVFYAREENKNEKIYPPRIFLYLVRFARFDFSQRYVKNPERPFFRLGELNLHDFSKLGIM